jgi:alginate biosynthesis protein AlgX
MMTKRRAVHVVIASVLSASGACAETQSGFGCSAYEFSAALPAVEGDEGVFYRTFADLRMQHAMDDRTIALMRRLSEALAENGTTLVYVSVPSKSQGMPQYLPEHAADYSFDQKIADQAYSDIITGLNAAGIIAPDIMTALRNATGDDRAFFGADFHWTSTGARAAAQAIGTMIKADPAYADLPVQTYVSTPTERQVAFSGMRRSLQGFCANALPPPETLTYKTEAVATDNADAASLDIFAASDVTIPIVLVGTSFSDSPINNFPGFIMEYTGLDVVNYAVTGGNQYGAITSYMTSDEFQTQRPRFLIWESPIYTNLAQYGAAPMEELIAAAGDTCNMPLPVTKVDEYTVSASLAGIKTGPQDFIYAAQGAEGSRAATFSLQTPDAVTRTAKIERGERLRATGNFYLGLSAYAMPAFDTVSVRFDRPVTDATHLTYCANIAGEKS